MAKIEVSTAHRLCNNPRMPRLVPAFTYQVVPQASRGFPVFFKSTCTMAPQRPAAAECARVDLGSLVAHCARRVSCASERIVAVHEKRLACGGLRVVYKDATDARSALTEADAAAQAEIVPSVRAHFPDIAVVGEEESDDELEQSEENGESEHPDFDLELGDAPAKEVVVFVDPVDGTREFVEGRLQNVQTLVGICVYGRPVAGVVSIPFAPDSPVLVSSVPAKQVHNLESVSKRCEARKESGVVVTVSKNPTGIFNEIINVIDPASTLQLGGAGNKLLRLVSGEADVAVLNLICSSWDTAGPESLVRAQGGIVTDMFGSPLVYQANGRLNNSFGVVATSRSFTERDPCHRTHKQLCAGIRASCVADKLLAESGLVSGGQKQASDVARDLDGDVLNVELLKETISPHIVSYSAPERGAVRYLMSEAVRLELKYNDDAPDGVPESAFLKRVVMTDLEHVRLKQRSAPEKLSRDVTSYQVESAFLGSKACSRLVDSGASIARPYHVEGRPADVGTPPIESRFLLLMKDFTPSEGWIQDGLLDLKQTCSCLSALATLHAFFWNHSENAGAAESDELNSAVWNVGSYWEPSKQPDSQFDNVESSWTKHCAAFASEFEQLEQDKQAQNRFPLSNLGAVLQRHARTAAERVHGPESRRTLVHGDTKAANFFLRRQQDDSWEAGMIDFQWCGWGHPLLDVAYLLATSTRADVLVEREEALLSFYSDSLVAELIRLGTGDAESLPMDELKTMYDEAIIDLARVVFAYHWVRINASPEVLQSRADKLGSNSYNKNVQCAEWLVDKVWSLLSAREN